MSQTDVCGYTQKMLTEKARGVREFISSHIGYENRVERDGVREDDAFFSVEPKEIAEPRAREDVGILLKGDWLHLKLATELHCGTEYEHHSIRLSWSRDDRGGDTALSSNSLLAIGLAFPVQFLRCKRGSSVRVQRAILLSAPRDELFDVDVDAPHG